MSGGSSAKPRRSGLLLHLSSLPSRYAIGDLGATAHQFIDQLAASGQSYWQMLPIGPTGYGNSPYQLLSTFAGNPMLLSVDKLLEDGLIDDAGRLETPPSDRVDFSLVFGHKPGLVRQAAHAFRNQPGEDAERFERFRTEHRSVWLDDFSLFEALKQSHGERPWCQWDEGVAVGDPGELSSARDRLSEEIELNEIVQFLFFEQWRELRDHAKDAGIALVGDLPLYLAHDSADVWANRDLFQLDATGSPVVVAGVPPDYFSVTGQRWGNPIYDWSKMADRGYRWWKSRVRHALALFDVVRIDHFRGIAGYWEIPAAEPTAVNGRWRPGPSYDLMEAIGGDTISGSIVAEDLGVITEDVIALRERYHLPGMRVAQFGYDDAPDAPIHVPGAYPVDVWGYTGTHDNDTTEGWFWTANPDHDPGLLDPRRRSLFDEVGEHIAWGLIEMVADSKAQTSIFPVQDILGLGSEARMNTPGTVEGNWEWRLGKDLLTEDALSRLRDVTESTGRGSGRD